MDCFVFVCGSGSKYDYSAALHPSQTPRKVIAEKFNLSPATVGNILLKRKQIEGGLSQGINSKRKRIRFLAIIVDFPVVVFLLKIAFKVI